MMIKTAKVTKMLNEHGQILLILILVMTVALAIGISVIQRSLSDISTSTKVEESSRAFSAAEAGIEKAITTGSGNVRVSFPENQSSANVPDSSWGPAAPSVGNQQAALEYPPLSKEDVVQVWLADPDSSNNPPTDFYKQNTLDVYWGDPAVTFATDKAALELTLVYYNSFTKEYLNRKWYLDNSTVTRTPDNNFDTSPTCTGPIRIGLNDYQCRKTLGDNTCNTRSGSCANNGPLPGGITQHLMLLRARLLYNLKPQPFAVRAVTCPSSASNCNGYSLPPQARTLISTGIAGGTQRTIQVFQTKKFVLPFLDFAIFSAGEINK